MKHLKYLPHRLGFFSEPYELFLGFVALLSGALYWTGQSKPGALQMQLPHWQLNVWESLFMAGGVLIIVSRALIARAKTVRDLEQGSRIEALGCTVFGGAAGMYAMALFAVGKPGFFAGVTIAAWSAASAVRAYIVLKQWAPFRKDRNGKVDDGT